MHQEAYIQLAIFYGGLSAFLVGAVVYALRLQRRVTVKIVPVASQAIRTESPNVHDRKLYFELMDRARVASGYVQMALGEHQALARHPELMTLYREVVGKLEDLHQAAGTLGNP